MKEYNAEIHFYKTEQGGRRLTLSIGNYRPVLVFGDNNYRCQINWKKGTTISPGDTVTVIVRVLDCPIGIGDDFTLWELKEIAAGKIISSCAT